MDKRAAKKNQRFVRIIECEITSALFQKKNFQKKKKRKKRERKINQIFDSY